jgi:hypothetical protein
VIEDYFVDPIQKINIFALKTDQLRRLEHVIDITKELKRRNLKVTNILRRKS